LGHHINVFITSDCFFYLLCAEKDLRRQQNHHKEKHGVCVLQSNSFAQRHRRLPSKVSGENVGNRHFGNDHHVTQQHQISRKSQGLVFSGGGVAGQFVGRQRLLDLHQIFMPHHIDNNLDFFLTENTITIGVNNVKQLSKTKQEGGMS